MAVARFNLTPSQFMNLTPVEFDEALNDHIDAYREKEKSANERHKKLLETIRLQTWWLINIQLPRNKRIRSIKRIMHFNWEDEKKVTQTKEQMKAVMKSIASHFKNKKSKNKRK